MPGEENPNIGRSYWQPVPYNPDRLLKIVLFLYPIIYYNRSLSDNWQLLEFKSFRVIDFNRKIISISEAAECFDDHRQTLIAQSFLFSSLIFHNNLLPRPHVEHILQKGQRVQGLFVRFFDQLWKPSMQVIHYSNH